MRQCSSFRNGDRLSYNSKTGKAVQGRGELVDALTTKGSTSGDRSETTSTELQKLDRNELQKRVRETRDDRAYLQKQIVEVSKKREAYIQSETNGSRRSKGDAFDQRLLKRFTPKPLKGNQY